MAKDKEIRLLPFDVDEIWPMAMCVTRDGRPARYITCNYDSECYPVLAEVGDNIQSYTLEGQVVGSYGSPGDLFMVEGRLRPVVYALRYGWNYEPVKSDFSDVRLFWSRDDAVAEWEKKVSWIRGDPELREWFFDDGSRLYDEQNDSIQRLNVSIAETNDYIYAYIEELEIN